MFISSHSWELRGNPTPRHRLDWFFFSAPSAFCCPGTPIAGHTKNTWVGTSNRAPSEGGFHSPACGSLFAVLTLWRRCRSCPPLWCSSHPRWRPWCSRWWHAGSTWNTTHFGRMLLLVLDGVSAPGNPRLRLTYFFAFLGVMLKGGPGGPKLLGKTSTHIWSFP